MDLPSRPERVGTTENGMIHRRNVRPSSKTMIEVEPPKSPRDRARQVSLAPAPAETVSKCG